MVLDINQGEKLRSKVVAALFGTKCYSLKIITFRFVYGGVYLCSSKNLIYVTNPDISYNQ
jgi:hypothetical protein